MITDYSIFVHSMVRGEAGIWAAESYPKERNWTVEFTGKAKTKDEEKLLCLAAIEGLSDLIVPCNITLMTCHEGFFELVAGLGHGDVPKVPYLGTVKKLAGEIARHKLTVLHVSKDMKQFRSLDRLLLNGKG